MIGLYQRTTQNPYKGWRWTAAANPTSSYKDWAVWDDEEEPDDGDWCGAEQCAVVGTQVGVNGGTCPISIANAAGLILEAAVSL